MIFEKTALQGAYVIKVERLTDERGFFARTWCQKEFAAHGLNPRLVQCSISFNNRSGTMRGMHYQAKPFEEAKLVRCTRGSIYDVIVDLRPESSTYMHHASFFLRSSEQTALYVPEGFAHGFLTMEDNVEVLYQMSEFFAPESARGFRWDDPAFGIELPASVEVISERDRTYPDFTAY